MKQVTIAENTRSVASATFANHIFSLTSSAFTATSSTVAISKPTLKVRYNTNANGRNGLNDNVLVRAEINGINALYSRFTTGSISLAYNTDKELTKSNSTAWSFDTADLFNANNSTTRVVDINWTIALRTRSESVTTGTYEQGGIMVIAYRQGDEGEEYYATITAEGTVTLNVPPTFDVSPISFNTAQAYAGLTTASVTVSNSTAYYGGSISSATLTIGNQTTSISGDGTLSIALNAGGTFTPTITVTDSRGQTATQTLSPITVNVYNAPSVTITQVERTTSTGTPDDEGAYAVINPTLTFADAIATAVAPTVAVTDEGGNTVSSTVTWYSSRASDGTLSGSVTWSSLSSGATGYGLITATGGFSTQQSYQIVVTPNDSEGAGTTQAVTLSTAFFTVDFLAGGHGIAFGQPASQTGFECSMQATFKSGLYINSYKVPIIYISTVAPTSNDGENGDVWLVYS